MNKTTFLLELINRLFLKKNPRFFDHLQIAMAIVILLSFGIDAIEEIGVIVPKWINVLDSMFVKAGAFIALLIAELPNEDPNSAGKEAVK